MSANNIIVIIKESDGKFRGYHRDMDAWVEGQYNNGGPCPCLVDVDLSEFEKELNGVDKVLLQALGVKCADLNCAICNGTGVIPDIKETPVFEADTIEGAIHAYDKWLAEMNNNEDGFPFVVEYGYTFVGLANQETKETLEKSERGEDLHKVDSVEELMKDLNDDSEPNGTAKGEYMHESLEKDAVQYDLPLEEIIQALSEDNRILKVENEKLKNRLAIIDEAMVGKRDRET